MERSCSRSRLKRLLLPVLGGPAMASENPVRTKFPIDEAAGERGGLGHDGIQPAEDFGYGRDADIVLGEIDAGLEQGD